MITVPRAIRVWHPERTPGFRCWPGRRTTNVDEITIDALECISRKTLIERNTVHRHGPEIARLVQLRGAVNRQIRKHERNEA